MIFDGKSEDFATEMFVIINSTPTRINKSRLVACDVLVIVVEHMHQARPDPWLSQYGSLKKIVVDGDGRLLGVLAVVAS